MRIANPTARLGEDIATEYLKQKKYKIIERNFRKSKGEIDIIAIDKSEGINVLVFVEVKTRTSRDYGTGLESILRWKLRTIIKTAQFYKLINKNLPESLRIDAIGIDISGEKPIIEHIKSVTSYIDLIV